MFPKYNTDSKVSVRPSTATVALGQKLSQKVKCHQYRVEVEETGDGNQVETGQWPGRMN